MSLTPQSAHCNLLITTPTAVRLHSQSSDKPLFQCSAQGGIRNTRAAKDNSGLLAVADGHLVILHEQGRSKDRPYELRSGNGEPRLLSFSPDSSTLYFTTTLSHSIEAYSIPTDELLPPLKPHPSPPNVLTISEPGDVLLSASPKPPTIFIHDLTSPAQLPLRFLPIDVREPVQCAAFHPISTSAGSLFAIGFRDGTLSLYRLTMARQSLARGSVYQGSIYSENSRRTSFSSFREPVRVGSVTKLHKAAMGGVCTVSFLPGYQARVVSIGHDGKCRIIDFKDGGEILRTWRVPGAPKCLAVSTVSGWTTRPAKSPGPSVIFSGDGVDEDDHAVGAETEVLIAVGSEPGKVYVFNILGLFVHAIEVGAPIVSLEWVGDMSGRSMLPTRRVSSTWASADALHPPSSPVFNILFDRFDAGDDLDQSSGTVKITRKKTRDAEGQNNPSPNLPPGDLFSASPHQCISPNFSKRLVRSKSGSPGERPRIIQLPSKSYARPRIMSETFKSPCSPPTATNVIISSQPATPLSSSPQSPPYQGRSPQPPARAPPPLPRALSPGNDGSFSVYSRDEEGRSPSPSSRALHLAGKSSSMFFTPPTSQYYSATSHRTTSFGALNSTHEVGFRATNPPNPGFVIADKGGKVSDPVLSGHYIVGQQEIQERRIEDKVGDGKGGDASSGRTMPKDRINRMRRFLRNDVPQPKGETVLQQQGAKSEKPRDMFAAKDKITATASVKEISSPEADVQEEPAQKRRKESEKDSWRLENERLRMEMRALREEFALLRSALLASKVVEGVV